MAEILGVASGLEGLRSARDAEDHLLLQVLEASLRKNLGRLRAIQVLCWDDSHTKPALEIARNMIEDIAHLGYIQLAPDERIDRFFGFRFIQLQQDMRFFRAAKLDFEISEEELLNTERAINEGVERFVADYPDIRSKDGAFSNSWVRMGVETMLHKLRKSGALPDGQVKMMLRAYSEGSRSTNFNPTDIIHYMDADDILPSSIKGIPGQRSWWAVSVSLRW